MGATATAIANMQALTRRHGPSLQAFVIVPIVGAFFIDLINLAVLSFYSWPGLIIGRQAKLRHNLENHASRITIYLIRGAG